MTLQVFSLRFWIRMPWSPVLLRDSFLTVAEANSVGSGFRWDPPLRVTTVQTKVNALVELGFCVIMMVTQSHPSLTFPQADEEIPDPTPAGPNKSCPDTTNVGWRY